MKTETLLERRHMRVLITGGTGFIGRAVIGALLARGDEVTAFSRRLPDRSPTGMERVVWKEWEPTRDGDWQQAIDGQNGIVHLAGEPAVGRRFTDEAKQKILQSRVGPTARLVRGIELAPGRPRVLVCASGVGFYGIKTGAATLTEQSPPGDDFLAQVCVAWEQAARAAEAFGTRVVSTRFGLVLGRDGGALGKLVPIFKGFVGGPLGDGKQPQPWVHLDDVVGAILKALDDETLSGPVNVAAPNPVNNAELSKILGRVLHRPSLLPAPGFALKALYGEGALPLLTGQRALPERLLQHGYSFRFTELEPALRDLLG
jgi:uncharacterized protein (TIGR01777 family)